MCFFIAVYPKHRRLVQNLHTKNLREKTTKKTRNGRGCKQWHQRAKKKEKNFLKHPFFGLYYLPQDWPSLHRGGIVGQVTRRKERIAFFPCFSHSLIIGAMICRVHLPLLVATAATTMAGEGRRWQARDESQCDNNGIRGGTERARDESAAANNDGIT